MDKLQITISLNRNLNSADEKAVLYLMSQWLVYDVKYSRRPQSAEIKLFHTAGAKPDLLKELAALFPNEHLPGM